MIFFQVSEVRKLPDPVPFKVGDDGPSLIIKVQSFPDIEECWNLYEHVVLSL